jgi:hypothetical protein
MNTKTFSNPKGKRNSGRGKAFSKQDSIKFYTVNLYTKNSVVNHSSFNRLDDTLKNAIREELPSSVDLNNMFTNDIGLLTNERCAMVLALFFRLNGKGDTTLSQKDLVSGVFQNFGHCDLEINTYKIIYKSKLTVCLKGLRYLEQSSLREICNSLLKQLNTIYYNSPEAKDIDLRSFLARKLFNAPSRTLNRKESDKGVKKREKSPIC